MLRDAIARELAFEIGLQFEEADFEVLSPLVDEQLPAVEDDEIWAAAVAGLARQLALRMPM